MFSNDFNDFEEEKMAENERKINDELVTVRMSVLRTKGFLSPGTHKGTITHKGLVMCNFEVEMAVDGVGFVIFSQVDPTTLESFEYGIGIEPVRCHYGGSRSFFLCPICRAKERLGRATVLYFNGQLFVCRNCCNVVYRSRIQPGRYRKSKSGY